VTSINLNAKQLKRYEEQLSVPGMTKQAQSRLLSGSALICGITGSGAVVARTLIQSGLGEIIVVDESLKELSRFNELIRSSIGKSTDTKVVLKAQNITDHQSESLIEECDVVIDSLDNWQEKLTLSDLCMSVGSPLVHAGVAGFRFQIYSMQPGKSACLRCALPLAGIDDVPINPLKLGKMDAISELVGAWQCMEAIKLVGKVGATQGNELFKFDCLSGEFEILRGLDRRHDCPDCGRSRRRAAR
jgi:molybdopterin/thiamine biosynthesis adenylyltransferase